ncbi:hypothetical protein HPB51_023501 [Rhipicephalus microplus]|uniref:Uncharacterized protein n=1 Tax=Rhipicephalus microplus TaxID=6941 RepID=A0A9J6EIU2_RHIMP|nr:hypothetical protein HPB51_023501 [Rhipicephalus microplus]
MNRVNDPYVNIGGAGCRWGDGESRRLPAVRHSCSGAGRRGHRPFSDMPSSQKPTRRAPRRPEPSAPGTSAPPKSTRRASRRRGSTSPPPPVSKTPGRSVATWARQEGQGVPRYFISDAPWKTQQRVRRDLPLDRVPWPFRSCTLVEGEKTAGGAQLSTDAAVGFCATCRVAVHFKSHYKGAMHVARTKAAAEGRATERKTLDPALLSQRSDTDLAALCRQRMGEDPHFAGEDPHFAALLSGLPPPVATDGPPMDGVATVDVDRLLEL